MESLGFSAIRSHHLQRDEFYSFLSSLDAFSFSRLVALTRTSNTTLNRVGKNRHPFKKKKKQKKTGILNLVSYFSR